MIRAIQSSLFDDGREVVYYDDDDETIQAQFEEFHRKYPEIYEEFKRIAQAKSRRYQHIGAKDIMEEIRYRRSFIRRGIEEKYKICNSYTSRYVRLLLQEEPRLMRFFELRKLQRR